MSDYWRKVSILMVEGQETSDDALHRQRMQFAIKHPHYTPPRGADFTLWLRWRDANTRQHGVRGFEERFPLHAQLFDLPMMGDDELVKKLEALSYPND